MVYYKKIVIWEKGSVVDRFLYIIYVLICICICLNFFYNYADMFLKIFFSFVVILLFIGSSYDYSLLEYGKKVIKYKKMRG